MKNKTPYIYVVIFITLCATFYLYKNRDLKLASIQQFKCPESYTEDNVGTEEYRNALLDWTSVFFAQNPKATMSEWSQAKNKLWQENNCLAAIERSKLSGEVSDLKPWELVDYDIQSTIERTYGKSE